MSRTDGTLELRVDCRNLLGEAPLWCAQSGTLYWVDVLQPGRVFHWSTASDAIDFWEFDDLVTGINLLASGGLLLHGRRDLWRFDPVQRRSQRLYCLPQADLPLRFNDGHCDRAGRLWIGSMYNNIAADGSPRPVAASVGQLIMFDGADSRAFDERFGCPNGLCFSPDGATFYAADSCDGWFYAYRFDAAQASIDTRRPWCQLEGLGIPDGAAVDRDGYLWNARWGAGAVVRISPSGKLDRVLRLPASQPTACCFGDPDRRTLYVTSARYGLSQQQLRLEPTAGGVFSVRVEVPGLGWTPFAA
ncbi:MAG: SMP-30/gluconolactonase/LRE family protein [Steroidobacteraceae bacterium]